MGFAIGFLQHGPVQTELVAGEQSERGRIVIEEFVEYFTSPMGYWMEADYRHQWREAIGRTVAGAARSCLMTAVYDPERANFMTWWPMYRERGVVYIQNHLLFLDQLTAPLDLRRPCQSVPARRTETDDGMPVSEWATAIEHLESWLRGEGT